MQLEGFPDFKAIYSALPEELKSRFLQIRLLIMDFDGTLTDNTVLSDQNGVESVVCSRYDSLGLDFIREHAKISVVILSKETNPVVATRARKLKLLSARGIDDKISSFHVALKEHGVEAGQTCYVGNDVNDMTCICEAGLGIAVADSDFRIRKKADYVTRLKGGYGAVREVCEIILYAKNMHPFP